MKNSIILLIAAASVICNEAAQAQVDTTARPAQIDTSAPPPAPPPSTPQEAPAGLYPQMYFGGTLGASFGDFTSIRISPMVGWLLSPKFAAGVKVGYEYTSDNRYNVDLTSHNYGASIFGEYYIVPALYAHAEFAYISYEYYTTSVNSSREWIPYLFAGGGYIQRISPSTGVYLEVLFDVLQDSRSPYQEWEPFVSIGVRVGI